MSHYSPCLSSPIPSQTSEPHKCSQGTAPTSSLVGLKPIMNGFPLSIKELHCPQEAGRCHIPHPLYHELIRALAHCHSHQVRPNFLLPRKASFQFLPPDFRPGCALQLLSHLPTWNRLGGNSGQMPGPTLENWRREQILSTHLSLQKRTPKDASMIELCDLDSPGVPRLETQTADPSPAKGKEPVLRAPGSAPF